MKAIVYTKYGPVLATWTIRSKNALMMTSTPIFASFSASRERSNKQAKSCLFANGRPK